MEDNEILIKAIEEAISPQKTMLTLWGVQHGLAIWIKTPNGHNHLIDAGTGGEFCPGEHISKFYHEDDLDYLVLSHPDQDHIQGLPGIVGNLGEPRVLTHNRSIPDSEKFGSCSHEYQRIYKDFDGRFRSPVADARNPCNPSYNGGVTAKYAFLKYEEGMAKNNCSVVVFYAYAGWLFVFPGDIEDAAWIKLWDQKASEFMPMVQNSKHRVLVAPHHGRDSGYSQSLVDAVKPSLVLISDKWGQQPTDRRFRDCATGLDFGGVNYTYFSTKNGGRMQFIITSDGSCTFEQLTLDQARGR